MMGDIDGAVFQKMMRFLLLIKYVINSRIDV